jgi:outer membrane protein OmpA-like peptidoglycan-associated protein
MKPINSLVIISLILVACAEIPSPSVQRPHFDDIKDSDRDGVINQRDHCSATPQGTVIDNYGCSKWHQSSEKETFTIDFDFNSSVIRSDQRLAIDSLVSTLGSFPGAVVELIGDTSSEGSSAYNQALALRRVQSIAQDLKVKGITEDRIHLHLYSDEDKSIANELMSRKRRTKAIVRHRGKQLVDRSWSIYTSEKQLQAPK